MINFGKSGGSGSGGSGSDGGGSGWKIGASTSLVITSGSTKQSFRIIGVPLRRQILWSMQQVMAILETLPGE